MIAWAGLEMYDAGYKNELNVQPIRRWSMDPASEDGGILRPENGVHEAKDKETKQEEASDGYERKVAISTNG
jgi:hypothetical protein